MRFVFLILISLWVPSVLWAQKKSNSVRNQSITPEEELAGFKVPEGFVVELVASEKDGIINSIDFTFDDAGRLWTQTAAMYPLAPVADIQWMERFAQPDEWSAGPAEPS